MHHRTTAHVHDRESLRTRLDIFVVVVDLGFTTLVISQVIRVALYSEREKFDI